MNHSYLKKVGKLIVRRFGKEKLSTMALIDFLLKIKKYYEIHLCGMQSSIF